MMCKLPDNILRELRENIDKVMASCSSALRVLKYYMLIGDDVEIS